jgi:hypothetical protein
MSETAFDKFGKQLMNDIRDHGIDKWDKILSGKMKGNSAKQILSMVSSFSDDQIETINKLVPFVIDGIMHDLLYLFEESDWIKISLQTQNETVTDIRDETGGDLQGYAFIWAEEFSKYPNSGLLSYKPRPDWL